MKETTNQTAKENTSKSYIKDSKNIFLIGIGGAGLSALALLLKENGKNISGSDQEENNKIKELKNSKIEIKKVHSENNITKKIDLVIYSSAITDKNPERIKAKKIQIPQISYPEALGEISKDKRTIAICGTHGKTTVTSIISSIFLRAKKAPTVIVGAKVSSLKNKNYKLGKSNWFIVEACEYKRNFLNIHPDIIVLNNIEYDHIDYFKTKKDYFNSFLEFVSKLPKNGDLIANIEDKNIKQLINIIKKDRSDIKIHTFGLKSGDINSKNVGKIKRNLYGEHNLKNILASITLSKVLKINKKIYLTEIENFKGVERRLEFIKNINSVPLYSDYAHHPKEIKATIQAIKEKHGGKSKVLIVFQPHQYRRTYELKTEFIRAFDKADLTIISDIFESRDTKEDIKKIDSKKLVKEINKYNNNVIYGGEGKNRKKFEKTIKLIKENIKKVDSIIIMGAGDINKIIEKL